MSDVALASDMARKLVDIEARGPGDRSGAMERLTRRYGFAASTLWTLLYRQNSTAVARAWGKLVEAYDAECLKQVERLDHEIKITRQINAVGPDSLGEAEALVAAARRSLAEAKAALVEQERD